MGEITIDCGFSGSSGSGGVETLDARDFDRREVDEAASSWAAGVDAPFSCCEAVGVPSAQSISVSSSKSFLDPSSASSSISASRIASFNSISG